MPTWINVADRLADIGTSIAIESTPNNGIYLLGVGASIEVSRRGEKYRTLVRALDDPLGGLEYDTLDEALIDSLRGIWDAIMQERTSLAPAALEVATLIDRLHGDDQRQGDNQ